MTVKDSVFRWAAWFMLLACVLLAVSCGGGNEPPVEEVTPGRSLRVFAVNAPLAWMADEIGGERVAVEMPVPEGVDPAHWKPDGAQILAWQGADLVLLNGAGYAPWIQYASLSPERLLDTSAGFKDRLIPLEGAGTVHSHGPRGDHSHSSYATTIWLDLTLAARQAQSVFEALVALSPDDRRLFAQGHRELQSYFERLELDVSEALEPLRAKTIIYSHPVYAYFARAYGLPGASMHWEPQDMPDEAAWARFERDLAGPALMIWEQQPSSAITERLSQLKVEVLVWQLGAGNPWREFAAVMERNLAAARAPGSD